MLICLEWAVDEQEWTKKHTCSIFFRQSCNMCTLVFWMPVSMTCSSIFQTMFSFFYSICFPNVARQRLLFPGTSLSNDSFTAHAKACIMNFDAFQSTYMGHITQIAGWKNVTDFFLWRTAKHIWEPDPLKKNGMPSIMRDTWVWMEI